MGKSEPLSGGQFLGLESHPAFNYCVALAGGRDPKRVGAILYFLSRDEVRSTLAAWAEDSPHAKLLADLSYQVLALKSDLSTLYVPQHEKKIKQAFKAEISDFYLPVLLACRSLPILSSGDASDLVGQRESIDRLKAMCLVQSVAALSAGFPRERHLAECCQSLRLAVENLDADRLEVFRYTQPDKNLPYRLTLDKLARDIKKVPSLLPKTLTLVQKRTLASLRHVVNEEWVEMSPLQQSAFEVDPSLLLQLQSQQPPRYSIPTVVHEDEIDDSGSTSPADKVIEVSLPSQMGTPQGAVRGKGVIFQNLEMSLLLPGSWLRPTRPEIDRLIAKCLAWLEPDQEHEDRLCAAMVLISIICGKSLSACQQIPLCKDVLPDWGIDLRSGVIQRQPPRFQQGWTATSEAINDGWIAKPLNYWRVTLSSNLLAVLRSLKPRGTACSTLGNLWNAISNTSSVEQHFRSRLDPEASLERLSTRMISEVLPTLLIEQGVDQAEIALLASSVRSALPAKCAYLSLKTPAVAGRLAHVLHAGIGTVAFPTSTQLALDNGAGSEMMLDVHRIRKDVRDLYRQLSLSVNDPAQWVRSHNLSTLILVLGLFASSATRPVNSPFETLAHFDLANLLAFVSDKQGGRAHNARLVLLPKRLVGWLSDFYCKHLRALQSLSNPTESAGNSFRSALVELLAGSRGAHFPFLFFLRDENGEVKWEEVTESTLVSIGGLKWPVALNLFRHLFSTYCTQRGLDPDIRDALLGHADRYAEPHGDFSPRVPKHDFNKARPIVEELFEEIFAGAELREIALPQGRTYNFRLDQRAFGERARDERRAIVHESTIAATRAELEDKTSDQDLTVWRREDWYQLGRSMLVRSDGGPHSLGWLRYQVYENYLEELWRDKKVHARPTAKFVRLGAAQPYFTPKVIGAETKLERVQAAFEMLVQSNPRVHDSPTTAAYLACVDLILNHKVSSWRALHQVVMAPDRLRVVRLEGVLWLEWPLNDGQQWKDVKAQWRIPLSARAASWIGFAKKSKNKKSSWPKIPSSLKSLWHSIAEAMSEDKDVDGQVLLKALAEIREQANNLNMPGILAAYLGQRVVNSCLPHSSLLRAKGQMPLAREEANSQPNDEMLSPEKLAQILIPEAKSDKESANQDLFSVAHELMEEVFATIAKPSLTKEQMHSAVRKAIQASPLPFGNPVRELASYALYLLQRPKLKGTGFLVGSSVQRDLYEIKKGFLNGACDATLIGLDDDELTELYEQIVEACDPEGDFQSDLRVRAGRELQLFHRFAQQTLGLTEPEWSDICPGNSWLQMNPGLVTFTEYLRALSLLVPSQVGLLKDDELRVASCMVICARFGLRLGESLGLQRRDVVGFSGSLLVLVRANRIRRIKSDSSKRMVPLLGELTATEEDVISEILKRWETRPDYSDRSALHAGLDKVNFKGVRSRTSQQINAALRQATGDPGVTTHHLRHAFAMRMLDRILSLGVFDSTDPAGLDGQHLCRLLLNVSESDKRGLWAVSRLLGHANPGVTLGSYLHAFDLWLAKQLDVQRANLDWVHVDLDLDKLEKVQLVKDTQPVLATESGQTLTSMEDVVACMRLVGRGLPIDLASRRLKLASHQRDRLHQALQELNAVVYQAKSAEHGIDDLLRGVPDSEWGRMLERTKLISIDQSNALVEELTLSDAIGMINQRWQIVLYKTAQLSAIKMFVKALGLDLGKLTIVYHEECNVKFVQELSEGVSCSLRKKEERLDRHVTTSGLIYKNRAVIVWGQQGQESRRELALMWLAFRLTRLWQSTFLEPSLSK